MTASVMDGLGVGSGEAGRQASPYDGPGQRPTAAWEMGCGGKRGKQLVNPYSSKEAGPPEVWQKVG